MSNNILKMFDTVAASEEGAWLHLNVPASEEKAYLDGSKRKKPLRLKLQGPDSNVWVSFIRKASRAGAKSESIEDTDLHDAKLLAKMTLGWENIPDNEGKELAFSYEAAVKLYRDYKDLRVQALKHIGNQEAFIKKQQEL